MSLDSILLIVLGVILTALGSISATFLSDIRREMVKMREDLADFKESVPRTYVTKEDLRNHCTMRHDHQHS